MQKLGRENPQKEGYDIEGRERNESPQARTYSSTIASLCLNFSDVLLSLRKFLSAIRWAWHSSLRVAPPPLPLPVVLPLPLRPRLLWTWSAQVTAPCPDGDTEPEPEDIDDRGEATGEVVCRAATVRF